MLKSRLCLVYIFLCFILFPLWGQASSLCVVSLLHEKPLNKTLLKEVSKYLKKMGHLSSQRPSVAHRKDKPEESEKKKEYKDFFKFYGDLVGVSEVYGALKNCLGGGYEEVIIVAHSMKNIIGQPRLIFPYQRIKGKVATSFINDRFFANLNHNPMIKQISVIGCNSEEVLPNYPNLLNYVSRYNINLKQAPTDTVLSKKQGVTRGRSFKSVISMLAEAAQPIESEVLFCRIHFQTSDVYSCLRGHIQIEAMDESLLPVERWIRIHRNANGISWIFLGPDEESSRPPSLPDNHHNSSIGLLPGDVIYEDQGYRIFFVKEKEIGLH